MHSGPLFRGSVTISDKLITNRQKIITSSYAPGKKMLGKPTQRFLSSQRHPEHNVKTNI